MGRPLRVSEIGYIHHVLNRANPRLTLFHKDSDYADFHRVLEEACTHEPMCVLSWCAMPNHWQLSSGPPKTVPYRRSWLG
jgi:putative transposase